MQLTVAVLLMGLQLVLLAYNAIGLYCAAQERGTTYNPETRIN
jgi:hypothetical protein